MIACQVLTRHFWLIIEIGGPLDCIFGKIFLGNIFNHQDDPLGIILSKNLSLQDHWFGFYITLKVGMRGFNASFLVRYQNWRFVGPYFWQNIFWEYLVSQNSCSRDYFKPNFRSLGQLVLILQVFLSKNSFLWSKIDVFEAFEHLFWIFLA